MAGDEWMVLHVDPDQVFLVVDRVAGLHNVGLGREDHVWGNMPFIPTAQVFSVIITDVKDACQDIDYAKTRPWGALLANEIICVTDVLFPAALLQHILVKEHPEHV
jgi:hypothetical protein